MKETPTCKQWIFIEAICRELRLHYSHFGRRLLTYEDAQTFINKYKEEFRKSGLRKGKKT